MSPLSIKDRTDLMFRTRHIYGLVFNTPEGRLVLADQFKFVRFGQPIMVPGDPWTSGFNDGMQRPIFRVTKFLNMPDAEILRVAQQPTEAIDG